MATKQHVTKPTIKDVALRAGVSPTTVSYVLNHSRFVSPDTKARIQVAIDDLKYTPDDIARSLRARRTLSVGMVVSDITNPFFADVVRGAEDVLSDNGYSLILCNTDESPENEMANLQMLRNKKVDGVMIVPTGHNDEQLYAASDSDLPIILLDRRLEEDRLDTVLADDFKGTYQAIRHLIEHGHRRIGMIMSRCGISTTTHRCKGYEAAFRDLGLTPDENLMIDGNSNIEGGSAATRKLLDINPRPTAIFSSNNLMTVGLFLVIKERHLTCPNDLAVIGFDDMVWFSVFNPGLTSVAQPKYELGRHAADLLIKRMSGDKTGFPSIVELPSRLVIRESCGCKEVKR